MKQKVKGHSEIVNSNSQSPSKSLIKIEDLQTLDINIKDLSFDLNDSNITLMAKNKKLSQYVIRLSNKISKMNEQTEYLQINHEKEKEEFLERLDNIEVNYKTFAESHKKLSNVERNLRKSENLNQIYEEFTKECLNDTIKIISTFTQELD